MGSRGLQSGDPRGLRRALGVGWAAVGGPAGRPARHQRRQEAFAWEVGGGGQEHTAGLPPSLTFSGRVPSLCGDQGPLPWAPSGREAHTECFPTSCSKSRACVIPHPHVHTPWRGRGCVAGGGAQAWGESVRSLSAWLGSRQMFRFILNFQKIGHFFPLCPWGGLLGRGAHSE